MAGAAHTVPTVPTPAAAGPSRRLGGSTFCRGAAARGMLGGCVAAAALCLAWGIERAPQPADPGRVVPPTNHPDKVAGPAEAAELVKTGEYRTARFESTFSARWTVTSQNLPLTPSSSDATQWVGAIPGGEVVVTATPTDPGDANLHGVRIALGDGVRAEWGNGAVTAVIPQQSAKP